MAVPDFVESATDVAVIVTCCVPPIDEGAVYKPAELMVPAAGLKTPGDRLVPCSGYAC
jgi:hypothetical protein